MTARTGNSGSLDLNAVYADLPDGHAEPGADRDLVDDIACEGASAYGELLPTGARILPDLRPPMPPTL